MEASSSSSSSVIMAAASSSSSSSSCFACCFRFIKLRRKRCLERVADVTSTSATSITASRSQGEEAQRKQGLHQNHPRQFSWDELERFSSNFSRVVGSGGFSTVYLSQFPDSSLGAIKMIHGASSSQRLHRVFKQELDILLRLRHDNIVKLLGYSDHPEESILVFEYVPNGNLQDKLHTEEEEESGLSWNSRIKIAFQLAQALEYLHHKCPLQIVHGDIKASNILLDRHLNCKLCDFGSAKMGFASSVLPPFSSSSSAMSSSSSSRMMLGSPGYADPHYLRTGIASKKNDVYSFGVILLQLITGREALCSRTGHKLTSIAAPALRDPSKLPQLLDPRLLRGDDPELLEQVKVMASISAMCLCDSPALRPSASDILNAIATNIPSFPFPSSYYYSSSSS
ncbi:probable receptor-like protein kinase At4g10390 [Coffea eugenioides]|uniref:probable receptor-like protein kinase At4g10390 n=1 Tax=Coffea eugenioides TaxID=49369 RepID=UPI000F60692B|nr:probable receptor-like protein kinase At4g10390 [Coffea eugenioides]